MRSELERIKEQKETNVDELFELLSGLSREELEQLKTKVLDRSEFKEHVASVLPSAVSRSLKQDNQLSDRLSPLVEQSVEKSINKNPSKLARVLSPLMGPMIRSSIIRTLETYMQSLDLMIQNSFSINALKWRFQAWRKGIKYSEFVLRKMLNYRVERALIFKIEDGILLVGAARNESMKNDDLFTSMLTAIQDFTNDSLKLDSKSPIRSIDVKDQKILLATGKNTVLATVSWGYLPSDFQTRLQDTIEDFESIYYQQIENFNGDVEIFSNYEDNLRDLLEDSYIERKKEKPWKALLLISILFGFCVFKAISFYQKEHQWNKFVNTISEQAGVIITTNDRQGNDYYLQGLQDPLSIDIQQAFQNNFGSNKHLESKLITFFSADSELILKRFEQVFTIPKEAILGLDQHSVLSIKGIVPYDWYQKVSQYYSTVPGLNAIDLTDTQFAEDLEFEQLIRDIQRRVIYFQFNSDVPTSEGNKNLELLAKDSLRLQEIQAILNKEISLELEMYTGRRGEAERNHVLSVLMQNNIVSHLSGKNVKIPVYQVHQAKDNCKTLYLECDGDQPFIFTTVKAQ